MENKAVYEGLMNAAKKARGFSYCPYSHFSVGAALLCGDGTVYTGCNIENGAFSPTCCAERTAVFKAVSEGKREFCAIAVCGGKESVNTTALCAPCGVCRQVLSEFCDADSFDVVLEDKSEKLIVKKLSHYLPDSFGLSFDER